ncbi:hypothetical protein JOC93_003136 [Priestia taiwanensis]|nr:hypothetical protein [Priestia taiwanensis]
MLKLLKPRIALMSEAGRRAPFKAMRELTSNDAVVLMEYSI